MGESERECTKKNLMNFNGLGHGAGKVAQPVKWLLCKHEDQNSVLRTRITKREAKWSALVFLALERQGLRGGGPLGLCGQPVTKGTSDHSKRYCLKKTR